MDVEIKRVHTMERIFRKLSQKEPDARDGVLYDYILMKCPEKANL